MIQPHELESFKVKSSKAKINFINFQTLLTFQLLSGFLLVSDGLLTTFTCTSVVLCALTTQW